MARQVLTAWAVVKEMQAQGIPVHLEPGWENRGSSTFSPRGLVVHHTADGPGEYPSLRIVRDGRSDLPGPLAQWGLGRSGKVYLIAAGRANHAGTGGWRGLSGNTSVWGIEAESTGRGDWTPEQRRNYPRLAAALARHQPFGPEMICAHREWTPRKPDPAGIDMQQFRADVARLLHGTPAPVPSPTRKRVPDMVLYWHQGAVFVAMGSHRSGFGLAPAQVDAYKEAGVPLIGRPGVNHPLHGLPVK